MLVLNTLDFKNIPPINFVLEGLPSSVLTGTPGRLYFNTTTRFVECFNGVTKIVLGGQTDTAATASTIAVRDGSGGLTASVFNGPLNGNAATATLAANATLFGGLAPAYYLSRANQTGTQLSATISDLPANIQATRLDLFQAPANTVNWNNQSLVNLADPVNPQDAVTKRYVDNTLAVTDSMFLTKAVYDPNNTGVVNYAITAQLFAGIAPAYYLNRGNQTGTQTSATISDFITRVETVTLDALAAPVNPVSMNGFKLTFLGTPGVATDAATKGYVDNSIATQPAPNWNSIVGIPLLRSPFVPLPNLTDTNPLQTEAEGYDQYLFYSASGWRAALTVPFRPWVAAPANSSAPGILGQSAYDDFFFYVCTGPTTWMRIALSSWPGSVPFTTTSAVPAGYTYTDGSFFYIATAVNTWQRFQLNSFSGITTGGSIPAQSYWPGLTGMETTDTVNNDWYVCVAQNTWATADLDSF
jgi:hypothetical protein